MVLTRTFALQESDHPDVYAQVRELQAVLGLEGEVELRVSRRRGVNAWVPRAGSKQLKITFTKDQLKARDLHWTVAHELAHLAAPPAVARETRRRSLAWALAHFAVGALVVLKFQSESYELALGLILLGTLGLEICALFSLFAGRRREEYRADAVATRLVGPKVSVDFLKHPDFVDGRLQRLEARLEYWADEQIDRRTLIGRLLYLFSSHPTLSERARALSQVKPETL